MARTVRDLRIAAMAGDRAAIRALLRREGKTELAKEVLGDSPLPPRVKRMVDCLTAGTNTDYEWADAHGVIHNALDPDDNPPRFGG